MGHLFKPTWVARLPDGRTVARRSRRWHVRWIDAEGRRRSRVAFTDKAASQALLTQLERDSERERAGLTPPEAKTLAATLDGLLEAFRRNLEAAGDSPKHVRQTINRVRRLAADLNATALRDLSPQAVDGWLARQLATRRLSRKTAGYYVACIRQFGRWLVTSGRLPANPFEAIGKPQHVELDRRLNRRALSREELGRLLESTRKSPRVFRGLSGEDRAALYATASTTGLRASELASLTRASLDLQGTPPTVQITAAYAKNRRSDTLPLADWLADWLRDWLAQRPTRHLDAAADRLWPGTWHQRAADMLRADLKPAGIVFENESGRFDFHSLRVQFAADLARVGVPLQVAQKLCRHSTPTLTANIYTRLGLLDLGAAVQALPRPLPPAADRPAEGR